MTTDRCPRCGSTDPVTRLNAGLIRTCMNKWHDTPTEADDLPQMTVDEWLNSDVTGPVEMTTEADDLPAQLESANGRGPNALLMDAAAARIRELEASSIIDRKQCDEMTAHAADMAVRIRELEADVAHLRSEIDYLNGADDD